jgi:hypothetical protein
VTHPSTSFNFSVLTGTIIKKIAYAVALPGLFVSVTIYTHVGAKMIFVRLLRYVVVHGALLPAIKLNLPKPSPAAEDQNT